MLSSIAAATIYVPANSVEGIPLSPSLPGVGLKAGSVSEPFCCCFTTGDSEHDV